MNDSMLEILPTRSDLKPFSVNFVSANTTSEPVERDADQQRSAILTSDFIAYMYYVVAYLRDKWIVMLCSRHGMREHAHSDDPGRHPGL